MKCKRCNTQLVKDEKAIYFHWTWYCPNCKSFIRNPEDMIKEAQ